MGEPIVDDFAARLARATEGRALPPRAAPPSQTTTDDAPNDRFPLRLPRPSLSCDSETAYRKALTLLNIGLRAAAPAALTFWAVSQVLTHVVQGSDTRISDQTSALAKILEPPPEENNSGVSAAVPQALGAPPSVLPSMP